jgi:hypothetical protein
MLSIRSTDTATIDVGGVLGFGGFHNGSSNQSQWAAIKGAKENSNVNDNASYLSFGTQVSAGNITERMRITSAGIIQIGADGIGGGGANNLKFNYEANASSRSWILGNDTAAFGDFAIQQSTTRTGTSYATVLYLGSTGNVGIGTNSPNYTLHVDNQGSSTTRLQITNSTTGNAGGVGIQLLNVGLNATLSNRSNGYLAFETVGNEIVRITNSGNVGIGTTSSVSSAKLSVMGTITAQSNGVDNSYQEAYIAHYSSNPTETNAILTAVSSVATQSGFQFAVSNGGGSASITVSMTINRSSVNVVGAISKGSGTFKIDHPLESKKDTNYLVHSFVEGPRADLIYRGKVTLVNGTATINIDETVGMTEGTFAALNRDVQCFTTNETGWDAVKGKVEGNILTITSQNTESTDEISWMVIGERQDEHIKNTEWTDADGKPILEPLK